MSSIKYSFEKVPEELNEELLNYYSGERTAFYWYGSKKYFFTSEFKNKYENYYNFKIRHDDIWVCCVPRTGSTVINELVWLLTHNLDYKRAKEIYLLERAPFFEFELIWHPEQKKEFLNENNGNVKNQKIIESMSEPGYVKLNNMESPRLIKTHFPVSMLPKDFQKIKPKLIYLARNAKDQAVSYYYLNRSWRIMNYKGDFKQFLQHYQQGSVLWGPYWEHIEEGWQMKHDDNVLFLFYEDTVKDIFGTIKKVAQFLSVNITDNETDELARHLHIANFKNNTSVNSSYAREVGIINLDDEHFIRQGTSRGNGKEFDNETLKQFNAWNEENCRKINITFPN